MSKPGTVKARNVDPEEISFAIDTALSWEGNFPKVGKGDFIVTIFSQDDGVTKVLVSRRYTEAVDAKQAGEIAYDAFVERNDINPDEGQVASVEAVV